MNLYLNIISYYFYRLLKRLLKMRQDKYFLPTLKETPNDAVITSHILMLRAGLIRQIGAGIFSWLPVGYRVLNKVMNILRSELNEIGGQEFLLPALNPIELWEATNRVEAMGEVMFHIKNRDGLVLAPTHEEIITFHAKQHINSYKDLPQIWYQIQNKFRNEPRPKGGVLRGRQFLMKDSYSLDNCWEGLDDSYQKHFEAYIAIFNSCGIKFFVVGASSGAMGGKQSQEFMVESEAGEDTCAITDSFSYSANVEVATSNVSPVGRIESNDEIELFATPKAKTINELVEMHKIDVNRCAKSVVYMIDEKPVLILMRGNDELNETKLSSFFGTNNYRPATGEELIINTGANGGSIGPINLNIKIEVYADMLLNGTNGMVSGANQDGYHYRNIDLGRDAEIKEFADFRTVLDGELNVKTGEALRVVKAIELGHIFKLGTKYSEALNAEFLDKDGKRQPIIMGSYGIGVERVIACYIEQNNDDSGIIWNKALTPFDIHLIELPAKNEPKVKEISEKLYAELESNGFDVLYDDRDERIGVKFNDADLIGLPFQIVVGAKNVINNQIEIKNRRTGQRDLIDIDNLLKYINENY